MTDYICPDCGKECQAIAIDDSFDYSGTHCTNGKAGTHHVDIYYGSDCCESEIPDYEPEDDGPDYDDRDASDFYDYWND